MGLRSKTGPDGLGPGSITDREVTRIECVSQAIAADVPIGSRVEDIHHEHWFLNTLLNCRARGAQVERQGAVNDMNGS
ncbi:hypothetical protein N7466_004536 [Penicillium verhagenii]|uniref:uncharacterized protein n=1 Tax=Penicillium verhagenii TaxID=1562060 RepID=UPI00254505BF|nr:uncharacterized protein N7466_004536 [Penicillium verhagenii]KAJ5934989.1 hypothetical protein N7466_004536 [Penicillium verhagenii]